MYQDWHCGAMSLPSQRSLNWETQHSLYCAKHHSLSFTAIITFLSLCSHGMESKVTTQLYATGFAAWTTLSTLSCMPIMLSKPVEWSFSAEFLPSSLYYRLLKCSWESISTFLRLSITVTWSVGFMVACFILGCSCMYRMHCCLWTSFISDTLGRQRKSREQD